MPLLSLKLDKTGHVPIYDQIKEQVLALMQAGQLKAGDQLPTIRALAVELAVNTNTVAHAYHELHVEGVIVTRRGEGTFVTGSNGEAERQQRREEKLQSLVKVLLSEASRLGYAWEEVQRAVNQQQPHASPLEEAQHE